MQRAMRTSISFAAAAAIAAAVTAPPAVADLVGPEGGDLFHAHGTEESAETAALSDATVVAERDGRPTAEVLAEARLQDDVSVALVELMDQHAATYAGARWTDDGVLELAFVGPPPPAALALLPPDVVVRPVVAPTSRDDLLAFVDEVASALRALDVAFVAVPDPFIGEVDVEVHEPLPPALPPLLEDDRITVREVVLDEPGLELTHGRGGQQQVSGDAWSCTTAFTVKKGSTRGQLTARHCHNTDLEQYEPDWPDDPSFTARFKAQAATKWGDLQWSETPGHGDYPTFYSKPAAWRTVARMGAAVPGQDLCHFGRTNGYDCQQVYKVDITWGSYSRGVMFHRNGYATGDSGGPVFWSTTGYGVNSAIQNYFGIKRGVFSQLIYIDEGLGLNMVYG